jgi:hypothetical protein
MLKLATDAERGHAHGLVRSEVAKIVEMDQIDDNRSVQYVATISPFIIISQEIQISYGTV